MFEIRPLDPKQYRGKLFAMHFTSPAYLDIARASAGFALEVLPFSKPRSFSFNQVILGDSIEHPEAFGAFEDEIFAGVVQGHFERWNRRYLMENLCVFADENRNEGIGTLLLEKMEETARSHSARLLTARIRSCNIPALGFLEAHGFEITGFDRYPYSNEDPERHEMRIELGKKLD